MLNLRVRCPFVACATVVAAVAWVSAGCAGDDTSAARPVEVPDCRAPASNPTTSIGDAVAFARNVGRTQGQALQDPSRAGDGRVFLKVGLFVRSGTRTTLTVPGYVPPATRLTGWSAGRETPRTLTIDVPKTSGCFWQPFPGGFLYRRDQPQCLRLTVEIQNTRQAVPFGLGRDC